MTTFGNILYESQQQRDNVLLITFIHNTSEYLLSAVVWLLNPLLNTGLVVTNCCFCQPAGLRRLETRQEQWLSWIPPASSVTQLYKENIS